MDPFTQNIQSKSTGVYRLELDEQELEEGWITRSTRLKRLKREVENDEMVSEEKSEEIVFKKVPVESF